MEVGETTEQSEVLSTEEVASIVEGTEPEAAVLPSDSVEFEVPEKFQGKSIEDVIKSYQELEKFKGKTEDTTEEEVVTKSEEGEEPSPKPTEVEEEQYQKYADSLDTNGSLSDAEYAELAKQGYDKATVDAEITRRSELQEFNNFKKEKALNDVLEPLGGGKDKFEAVSKWAAEAKSEADVKAFNEALAAAPVIARQAMLRGLYAEYDSTAQETDTVLHSNTPKRTPNKGYATQEEFFKDVGSTEYKNNPAYRKAVEDKMEKSDIF